MASGKGRRRLWLGTLGILAASLGVACGTARAPGGGPGARDVHVLHTPPRLALAGEPIELRFELACGFGSGEPVTSGPCGFVDGRLEAWREPSGLPLVARVSRSEGEAITARLEAPKEGWVAYRALLSTSSGLHAAPQEALAGGAPFRILVLPPQTPILPLSPVAAGPAKTLLSLPWGRGLGDAGLRAQGDDPGGPPLGPSAFDLDRQGRLWLADAGGARLKRFAPGTSLPGLVIPVQIGGWGDVVASDHGVVLLDAPPPHASRFASSGSPVAEAGLHRLAFGRAAAAGAALWAEGFPDELWFPLMEGDSPVGAGEQARRARPGQPLADGGQLLVAAAGAEVRAALADPRGGIAAAWRLRAPERAEHAAILAADAWPGLVRLVVGFVEGNEARTYSVALWPGEKTMAFEIPGNDFAEAAVPHGRFRLRPEGVYVMSTTDQGVKIVGYLTGGR